MITFFSGQPFALGQTTWTGTNGTWTNVNNWSTGIVPTGTTAVVFANLGTANSPSLGNNRSVESLTYVKTTANTIFGMVDFSFNVGTDIFTATGTTALTFRGGANGTVNVGRNLTVGNIVSFGDGSVTSDNVFSMMGTVSVGGTTSVSGTAAFVNTSTVNLGQLVTSTGGVLNLTHLIGGNSANGTTTGATNVITAQSLSGTAGTIQAAKASTTGHLTVSGSTNGTFSGTIINGNGTVRLTKAGSGTLALTAVNTYTGTTAISGGTLLISGAGSINGTSGIALSGGQLVQNSSVALAAPITWTGGAVSGTGTISGDLLASGGGAKALNPGNSPGKLTVSGDVTLDSLTTVNIEINGTTPITLYDVLSVGDALALNNAALNVSLGYAAQLNDQFIIANFVSLSGTFNGLADGSTFVVGDRTLQIDYTSSDIRLLVTAVPEPQTAVLLAAGGVALLVFRRRSRLK